MHVDIVMIDIKTRFQSQQVDYCPRQATGGTFSMGMLRPVATVLVNLPRVEIQSSPAILAARIHYVKSCPCS